MLYAIVLLLLATTTAHAEDVVLSTYTTYYQVDKAHMSRAANVELAAHKLNGAEVWPGDTLSYNDVVGPRSLANGFQIAHVIENKKLVDGVGGGACQVASTLHAASLTAGLDIVESHPHSLALSYIQASMDSTVAIPDGGGRAFDFRFRNNTQRPIRVVATTQIVSTPYGKAKHGQQPMLRRGLLTVQLVSDRPSGRETTVSFKILQETRRPTWRIKSHDVKAGVVVDQTGSDGYKITRKVTVRDAATGQVYLNQTKTFQYAPLPRILLVPAS